MTINNSVKYADNIKDNFLQEHKRFESPQKLIPDVTMKKFIKHIL